MEQPYNPLADWLSKFHTWPAGIQALWIVTLGAVLLSAIWSVRDVAVLLVRSRTRDRTAWNSSGDARDLGTFLRHGQPQEAVWADSPPELAALGRKIPSSSIGPEERGEP